MAFNGFSEEHDYASLSNCVAAIQLMNVDQEYLFRGERTTDWASTPTLGDRVSSNASTAKKHRDQIAKRVKDLQNELAEFLKLSDDLALGFLQHYEAPTHALDLTASPLVAAAFAARPADDEMGLIAIIPKTICAGMGLIDITAHPMAERPRRQHAHLLKCPPGFDLKSDEADALGVIWARFKHTDFDHILFSPYRKEIMDAHTDVVAGVLQLLMDDMPKLNEPAARYFADHLAASHLIMKMDPERPGEGELVSLATTGIAFDERTTRHASLRLWSTSFPDTRRLHFRER